MFGHCLSFILIAVTKHPDKKGITVQSQVLSILSGEVKSAGIWNSQSRYRPSLSDSTSVRCPLQGSPDCGKLTKLAVIATDIAVLTFRFEECERIRRLCTNAVPFYGRDWASWMLVSVGILGYSYVSIYVAIRNVEFISYQNTLSSPTLYVYVKF